MGKRLSENLSSLYIGAANKLKPKCSRRKIIAYVESYDDISFWRTLLGEYENETRYFEVMLPSKTTLAKGKKSVLMNELGPRLGQNMIACVDSDYDYLLQGATHTSRYIINNKYVFHTYAYAGHDMQRLEIEKSGSLRLAEGIYEQFDESGNAAYTMKKGEETDVITEEEYYAAFEKYSNATIVNFSYGASDAGKAEVVTNNELEPRQGNIAEDVNVLEIVQETASEFAVKKMETSYF